MCWTVISKTSAIVKNLNRLGIWKQFQMAKISLRYCTETGTGSWFLEDHLYYLKKVPHGEGAQLQNFWEGFYKIGGNLNLSNLTHA